MPGRTSSIKGVEHIPTHSGRANETRDTHQIYLKLGWLQMERQRKKKERQNTLQRLRRIDDRLERIREKKQALKAALEEQPRDCPVDEKGDDCDNEMDKPGFRLEY